MGNRGKINNIIENLRKLYQQKYGIAVFNISIKEIEKGIAIKGDVVTESQKDDIINILKKNKKRIVKENIKVLSDAGKRYETDWVVVKIKVADLKLRFVSNKILNGKILKRIRCSQAFKGEILRVVYKNEDQLLVQQNDLTLGWVNRGDVVLKKMNPSTDKACHERETNGEGMRGVKKRRRLDLYKKWANGNFALKGKAIKINYHSELDSESIIDFKNNILSCNKRKISDQRFKDIIIKEAEKYLGAEYLLGGKTGNGIDCSGLIQVAYKNSLDIILPKHSWDQKEMGKKVKLEDVETGDLVFLIKKRNKHKHVGIVEKNKSKINLIHALLDEKKVVRQNLKKVLKNYEFVEARKIVK